MGKQGKLILKLNNEKLEKQIIRLKKELHTRKKKKINNSTIETKFENSDNKVSMLENSNEVDEDKVTKENNISFSMDPTASSTSGIV